jgi:hypothetical protein
MNVLLLQVVWLSGLMFSLVTGVPDDPKAADILRKAVASIRESRSYQAVMVTTGTTPSGGFAMTSEWKLVPVEHKTSVKMSGNVFGEIMTATVIDDGKTLYSFNKERNVFSKGPHSLLKFAYPLKLVNEMLGSGEITYSKSELLMGRKVHVLKKQVTEFGLGIVPTVLLYFDQSTGRFVQMKRRRWK